MISIVNWRSPVSLDAILEIQRHFSLPEERLRFEESFLKLFRMHKFLRGIFQEFYAEDNEYDCEISLDL